MKECILVLSQYCERHDKPEPIAVSVMEERLLLDAATWNPINRSIPSHPVMMQCSAQRLSPSNLAEIIAREGYNSQRWLSPRLVHSRTTLFGPGAVLGRMEGERSRIVALHNDPKTSVHLKFSSRSGSHKHNQNCSQIVQLVVVTTRLYHS